jgi:hypothetical protein
MKEPDYVPEVKLIDEDGNAFAILGKVTKALRQSGADKEYVDDYINKACSGDYYFLLNVTSEFVNIR